MRRLARWLRRTLLALAALVVVTPLVLVLASRTEPVRELVRVRLVAILAGMTDARVRIGALEGTLGRTLVLRDVRVDVAGEPVVRVPAVEVVYALLPLLRGELRLDRVTLTAPRIRAIRTRDGWLLPHGVATERAPAAEGGGRRRLAVRIARLVVEDGRIAVALDTTAPPRRFAATALTLAASGRLAADGTSLRLETLRFVPRGVALSPVTASGAADVASGGAVRVSELALATARTRIEVDGSVDPGRSAAVEARLAPLSAADVRALLPSARLTADVRARARVHGPWSALASAAHAEFLPGGTLGGHGIVDATAAPLRWDVAAAFAALDPGAALPTLPRASLTGRLDAHGAGADPRGPLGYRLALDASRIGNDDIDRLLVEGEGVGGVHRFRAVVGAPVGSATAHGRIALARRPRYRVGVRWSLARLERFVSSTWGWANGRLRVAGRGIEPGDRHARADLVVGAAAVQGIPLENGEVHAQLAGTAVELRALRVASRPVGVKIDATGRLDLERRDVAFRLGAGADLRAIGAWLGRPLAGSATASVDVSGTLDALAATASAEVVAPAFQTLSAERATARVDVRGVGGASPSGRAALTATAFRIDAGTAYAAGADADWRRTGREDRASITLHADGDDGRKQGATFAVARTPDRTRADLQSLLVTPPQGPAWRLARPAGVVVDASAVTVETLTLGAGAQRIVVDGRIARGGTSDASLVLEHIALGPVCALAHGPECGGELGGRLELRGTAAAPLGRLTAEAHDVQVAKVAYGVIDMGARYADAAVAVEGALHHPKAGDVRVTGTVPVDLAWAGTRRNLDQAPVALTANADRLDLTILHALAPRTLSSSAGRLSVTATVSGPRAAPRLEGQLALDDGSIQLVAAGIPYEGIRARAIANGAHVELQELVVRAGDGTLEVHGAANLPPGGPIGLDVAARFDEFFAVRREAYEAALSGDLHVRGTLGAPDVSGTLEVDRAVVRPSALPASAPHIPEDPTIAVVGVAEPAEPPPPGASAAIPAPLTLGVTVRIARNAWIRRSDANIEIGGEIQIAKAAGEPVRVTGQIRLLRGWYVFQGRRLTLDQGTITFTGGTPIQPIYDIVAIYRSGEYRIEVHVSGSGEKPTLTLTSDPPLEQADILSVLLFGKPTHELGRGQSLALQQQAVALAAGYAVPELRASVMEALGLDVLEVELPKGSEAGRVSAGRYVAEDVFVSLGQEFGRRVGQVVGVEYSVTRRVSVRGSTSTRGDSAVDLFWHYRY